jgi:hypothetical protein
MMPDDLKDQVKALAARAGLGVAQKIERLAGGANNRVFRLTTTSGNEAVLKAYFRHPDDPRDRLGVEFAFARYAWTAGVRCLPQPLAYDDPSGLGLFEYVRGRRLLPEEVDEAAIDQALRFFTALNESRHGSDAARLPLASEACFSVEDHLACVRRRLERLTTLPVCTDLESEARTLVQGNLIPAWNEIEAEVRRAQPLGRDVQLAQAERVLSPSDFGYHNALLAEDGRLRFLDFEYAGWDDPVKLVCDFFCQPAVPAPPAAFARFARTIATVLPRPEVFLARTNLLLPVYQTKWCCILLNEFLPAGHRRRQFASPVSGLEERQAQQLDKARQGFAALVTGFIPWRHVA